MLRVDDDSDVFFYEPPTKIGRPKKKDEERRDIEFRVRLTPVEYAQLQQTAKNYDISMSDVLRYGLKELTE